jgi:hypothetical protein
MRLLRLANSEKFALVDDADWSSCDLVKWYLTEKAISGYMNFAMITLARFITQDTTSETIDHKDRNILNNQRENLRPATRQQQEANKATNKSNTSGYKGVSWSTSHHKWWARVKVNGKTIHLGYYKSKEYAANAYNKGSLKYFGEFAYQNQLPERPN